MSATKKTETVRSELEMEVGASKESGKEDQSKGAISKISLTGDKEPAGKAQKRTHSEVSETSAEELSIIHQQLDSLSTDLKATNESIKQLMTKDDIESFIKQTVTEVLKSLETKMERWIEAKVEQKVKEKVTELNDRFDHVTYENGEIKDRLDKVEEELKKEKERSRAAIEKSNYNEQYSRKNNVKVLGVPDLTNETETKLTTEVISIIKDKTDVDIAPTEIVAIHRIPSKLNPKPVLVKLMNNSVKTRLMKHRKTMKQQGHKLVDDVTIRNTKLISRLLEHKKIDSAWFFNGFIYGKTTEGKRYRFDLYSDIDAVINPKKEEEEGEEVE